MYWFNNKGTNNNYNNSHHSNINLQQSSLIPNHREIYEGEWWGGRPDGRGKMIRVNGDIYEGQWKNGLKHGQGRQYYMGEGGIEGNRGIIENGGNNPNNYFSSYIGSFINGLPDGYGKYCQPSTGTQYIGQFRHGQRHGEGQWVCGGQAVQKVNGDINTKNTTNNDIPNQYYKGDYKNDMRDGYGRYRYGNGYEYIGRWRLDKRDGQGQLRWNGNLVERGQWRDDQFGVGGGGGNSGVNQQGDNNAITPTNSKLYDALTTHYHDSTHPTGSTTNHSPPKQLSNQSSRASQLQTNPPSRIRVGHRNCIPCQQIRQYSAAKQKRQLSNHSRTINSRSNSRVKNNNKS